MRRILIVAGAILVALLLFPSMWAVGVKHDADRGNLVGDLGIEVPPPPFTDGIFPCSDCHDPEYMEVDRTPRKLEMMHEDIILNHDEKNRWCLACHDAGNRDKLHSASGEYIDFEESYKLCGQCHGPKLRDWKAGVHGKRTGYWNGEKHYLLCVHCHNPHSPRFKPVVPEPPPVKPEDIKK